MVTIKELAKELGVPPYTIHNLLYKSSLPITGMKMGKRLHFDQQNADVIRTAILALKCNKVVYGKEQQ